MSRAEDRNRFDFHFAFRVRAVVDARSWAG
jgi:hypothetical protein